MKNENNVMVLNKTNNEDPNLNISINLSSKLNETRLDSAVTTLIEYFKTLKQDNSTNEKMTVAIL